jgi:hypothetical protein
MLSILMVYIRILMITIAMMSMMIMKNLKEGTLDPSLDLTSLESTI